MSSGIEEGQDFCINYWTFGSKPTFRAKPARAGLLDALKALGPLRAAAVLVGAQGVYEYTRDVDDHLAASVVALAKDFLDAVDVPG